MKNNKEKINFIFFGTPQFAVTILERLKIHGLIPSLIVTNEDRPAGRGKKLSEPSAKIFAKKNDLPFIQPKTLKDLAAVGDLQKFVNENDVQVFIVAAYGKILPKNILDLAPKGILNVHPSALPLYRGPSPIESMILNDEKNAGRGTDSDASSSVGVSIMLIDEEMDHGPILSYAPASAEVLENWPVPASKLEKDLAEIGADLIALDLKDWCSGKIIPKAQDHSKATYTKKLVKTDGLIDPESGNSYKNFLKIQALENWPGTYFFDKNGKRIIIKKAHMDAEKLVIDRIVQEGKKETDYR